MECMRMRKVISTHNLAFHYWCLPAYHSNVLFNASKFKGFVAQTSNQPGWWLSAIINQFVIDLNTKSNWNGRLAYKSNWNDNDGSALLCLSTHSSHMKCVFVSIVYTTGVYWYTPTDFIMPAWQLSDNERGQLKMNNCMRSCQMFCGMVVKHKRTGRDISICTHIRTCTLELKLIVRKII